MNISFHYHLVKTMANLAKIDEPRAQEIAVNSQRIDDFNLFNYNPLKPNEFNPFGYIYLKNQPPDFFIKNKLAGKSKIPFTNTWWFYPVTTGISLGHSAVSALNLNHEKYTIVPFHFIPPKPLRDIKRSVDGRHHYRCELAGNNENTLMDSLLQDYTNMIPMQLGMLLHTYADTYSHQGFSGFEGAENFCDNQKAYDAMNEGKKVHISLLSKSPLPVGHGMMGHVPDVFAFDIYYDCFKIQEGSTEIEQDDQITGLYVGRSNMDMFLRCAKNILSILCNYNDKPFYSQWDSLVPVLQQIAGRVVSGDNELTDVGEVTSIWRHFFPRISYRYDKNPYFALEVDDVIDINKITLEKAGLTEADIYDMTSERGRQARECATIAYETVSNDFFQFNQLAYEHIHRVVGSYRPHTEELPDMADTPK